MKFLEYKVLELGTKKGNKPPPILKKELTKRGHVLISELDAREMNQDYDKTKLFYLKDTTKEDAEKEKSKKEK